ncbi:MAG: hypothetical protein N2169_04545 [bacterium]|nr:hypothetical protein [bacterium]
MKKGLTVIEVLISFSVALILVMSLYAIIYGNLKIKDINQYYIDVNNIIVFLSTEIQNNPSLYIEYNSSNNTFSYTTQANEKLMGKLSLYNYTIGGKKDFNIELQPIKSIPNIQNVLEVGISVIWKFERKTHNTKSTIILSTYEIIQEIPINLPPHSDIN